MIDQLKAEESKKLLQELIPTMEGWLTPERAVEMYELIRQTEPDLVVEIGVFGGRSLVAQAIALRDVGKGHICGIDPWKKEDCLDELENGQVAWWRDVDLEKIHQGCMRTIWSLALDPWVSVIRSASHHFAPVLPRIDILYIDGNHTETSSCRDVELYLPKVKQNGWIWFDDCDWQTTQKALGILDKACKLVRDCGNYRLYCKF